MTPQQNWVRCRAYIEAAIATGPGVETIEDVERFIEAGTYQIWFGDNCAIVTEICNYAQKRALRVVHGGGDLDELLDIMEPKIVAFARANGCDAVMGEGRKGWERIFEKRGYRFGWITMIKDLVQ